MNRRANKVGTPVLYSIGMRLIIPALFIAVLSGSFIHSSSAISSVEQLVPESTQALVVEETSAPVLSARAYGVFDVETGEILLSYNADQSLSIASVTKLFTAAAALKSEKLEEEVMVISSDVAAEGRSGKLEVGQLYHLRELLFPLLLESSNDAAEVFNRTLDKVPFADKFLADSSGLSSQNKATVNELAYEVRQVYLEEPYIFDITKLKQHIGKYTGWINNSPVQSLPGYQGGKHGYTEAANRTLVAIFSESSLGDRKLGYIILGSDNLLADTKELRAVVASSVHLE